MLVRGLAGVIDPFHRGIQEAFIHSLILPSIHSLPFIHTLSPGHHLVPPPGTICSAIQHHTYSIISTAPPIPIIPVSTSAMHRNHSLLQASASASVFVGRRRLFCLFLLLQLEPRPPESHILILIPGPGSVDASGRGS
jgi:hypothetical protein